VPLSGVIFLDFVNNLEKIGDHLTNVTQAVRGVLRWDKIRKTDE
jgi:Na+/phosphate symporter